MSYKIVTQNAFDFISLDEAKAQCRLLPDFTLDDTEINSLIIASCDIAQQYLNLMLTEGNVIHYIESYSDCFLLFGGNVTTINEVKASIGGVEETLPVDAYSLNTVNGNVRVSSDYSAYTDWYFDIDCGYSDLTRPEGVRHAILKLISTMYNHREDVTVGQSVEKMPNSSKLILGKYRRYVS